MMTINNDQRRAIKNLLREKITAKLGKYARETTSMPFLVKLMQDSEKVAAYSFIHSLATTLGMSVYEKVAKIIALPHYDCVETGYDVRGTISDQENLKITQIMQEIENSTRIVDKDREIKEILNCEFTGGREKKIRADLFLKRGEDEYYFEVKTAKPNIDVFNKSKQKLLEWVALRKKPVTTALVIPYNPYHPKPYSRFTIQGVLDEEKELLVAEKFWDFLGGKGTYEELLDIFDEVGKEFREQIQDKIREVAEEKMGG